MELGVEEFLEGLLSPESAEEPSDTVKGSELVLELPPYFDERKFKLGQKFFWDNVFACMMAMMAGLLSVIAVPSILAVLVHTRRSSSQYTAYKRYLATILHVVAWHKHPLQPGSVSWRSLHAVRSRHLRAGLSAERAGAVGRGRVSQRDLALTQFGFVGFTMLKADELGVIGYDAEAWDGLNHMWRTVGYMIGLKDKYNICRDSVEETRAVCRALLERVFAPCLHATPEPFEHMAHALIDGLWAVHPTSEVRSLLFFTRYLAEEPGFVYTERERIDLRAKLLRLRAPGDESVDSNLLLQTAAIKGLPAHETTLLKPNDFSLLETVPEYKKLTLYQKYKLNTLMYLHKFIYTTYLGRLYLNYNVYLSLWLMDNFPFLAFPRFGFKRAFVDLFTEGPQDDTVPELNRDSLKRQAEAPFCWKFWG